MKNKYTGLTESEVLKNQKLYGSNMILHNKKKKIFDKVIFLLLLLCIIIYLISGNIIYAIIFSVIEVIFLTGYLFQHIKIKKFKKNLNNSLTNTCQVIRNGQEITINSDEVTIDDIIVISSGKIICADAIILESKNLIVDESVLDNKNYNVKKSVDLLDKDADLKSNYLYTESIVLKGSGIAKVVNIGNKTEYAKIIALEKESKNNSVIKKNFNKMYRTFTIISIIIAVLTFIISTINNNILIGLLTSISVFIILIPKVTNETIDLIIYNFLNRFYIHKSFIKKMCSIEKISNISHLLVQDVGIITEDELFVKEFYANINEYDAIFNCIMASDNKKLDRIDRAILSFSKENNIITNQNYKLVKKYPYNDKSKMMANVYEYENELYIFVRGSLNSLFDICNLDVEEKYKLHNFHKQLHKKGLHVIAFASSRIDKIEDDIFKYNVNFNGILGVASIIKDDALTSLKELNELGINVTMITDDNNDISNSIGKKIKLNNYENIMCDNDIDKISDIELSNKIKNVGVLFRVSQNNKIKVINSLKYNNEVVSIISNSISEIEMLKTVDAGITLSKYGVEGLRRYSDLVLKDNNFITIVNTIKDSKRMCSNLKKLIRNIFIINLIFTILSILITLFNYHVALLLSTVLILKTILEIIIFIKSISCKFTN